MAQFRDEIGMCWGHLHHTGWDGIKQKMIAYCYKKARPGCLTCWSHRRQEYEAQKIQKQLQDIAARQETGEE
jgi:hypothetical protein